MIKKFYSHYYQKKAENDQGSLVFLKFEAIAFFFLLAVVLTIDQVKIIKNNLQARVLTPVNAQVLGETIVISPTSAEPTSIPPSSAPVPPETKNQELNTNELVPNSLISKKSSYTIAIFGDSMVDTMGERLEYLETALKKKYPQTAFNLYNYGVGGQNVEQGLARLHTSFDYQTRHYPPLSQIHPDIIILGSFAYNPFAPYDRDRHWLGLAKLIEEAKKITPNVYLLAEIAPLRDNFGRGPNGVNWDTETARVHSQKIIEELENAIGLSKNFPVILIDVFNTSVGDTQTKQSKTELVNPSDGIHPSVAGHEFTVTKILESLRLE